MGSDIFGRYEYTGRGSKRGTVFKSRREDARWDEIEALVLKRRVLPFFERKGRRDRLVDIGAGVGRYSKLFGTFFDQIIAIEPDPARMLELREAFKGDKRIKPISDFAENVNLPQSSVDAVLIIHLIQHITEESENNILSKAAEWLRQGGLLVACFTIESKLIRGYHLSWSDEDDKATFSSVPKFVYEWVVKSSPKGVLPVRKIRVREFVRKLEGMGFKVVIKEEYAFDFSNRMNVIARFLYGLVTLLPVVYQLEALLKRVGLKGYFLDCCILAEKR